MRIIPLSAASIGRDEIAAATKVLQSGWLTHGPKNEEFEDLMARYIGSRSAASVNSCASALFLTLLAAGIRGEVLVPSFTFVASVNAITACGATPVFIDIDDRTCNMSASLLEKHITPRTEAIMPVHYAGHPCDMKTIVKIADKHKLFLLEDAAECLGGECGGKKAGSFGTGCFSFFPTKNITSCEGGMVVTNDDALADKVKSLAGHGIKTTTSEREGKARKWFREAFYTGYNFRMSHVHAAIGVEQMKKVDKLNAQRRAIAAHYNKFLKPSEEVIVPVEQKSFKHVYQMYVVRVPASKRDALVQRLNERGIGASVHFDPPAHRQTAHRKYAPSGGLPVTEKICKEVITLPMYPSMKRKDAETVCRALLNELTTA